MHTNQNYLLAASSLSVKKQKKIILQNVNFNVQTHDIIAICGKNGAGKTTLLKVLSDQIIYSGNLEQKDGIKVAYVPDKPALYLDWTVLMYLKWSAELHQLFDNQRFNEIIEDCGLLNVLSEKIDNLSHGFKQRVSFAYALLSQPDILLLDEPANGLDREQIIIFREILSKFADNKTVIFTHHDFAEVSQIASKVWYISDHSLKEISLLPFQGSYFWLEWINESVATSMKASYQIGRFTRHLDLEILQQEGFDISEQLISVSRILPAEVLSLLLESTDV